MKLLLKLAPAAVVALLAACASPSPAPVLLTLPPVAAMPGAAAPTAPAAPASSPLLAVRRVSIPEYLVARRVRYRADAATLAEWPNSYWAERIEIGVSREFVSALRQQLPGWPICETTCNDAQPGLTLQVALVPMDYVRGDRMLRAHARITVSIEGAAPKLLQTSDVDFAITSNADTPQAQAQAISELLAKVASAAAATVRSARP